MIEHALLPDDLFATGQRLVPRLEVLGGKIPVILIDDVYLDPLRVRQTALRLDYKIPTYPYPGRIAALPSDNPSLTKLLRDMLDLVNRQYLPRVPLMMSGDGRTIQRFGRLNTDFGIIDVLPDQLAPTQRQPHTDPVPVFGLIYLNQEERGGTMFFEAGPLSPHAASRSGYFGTGDSEFALCGKIEGRFNRLAIYPGFVPHSGEISGDWIETDDRITNPRLTQRFLFFP